MDLVSRSGLAALCCLLATSASAQQPIDGSALMAKHLVRLADGRAMNLICVGQGAPTVIVESGVGSNMLHWQKVVQPLSTVSRTCFYDRAGYGFSDPAQRPMTAANVADDLHDLLRSAGISQPVVLVGHSLGGLYATLYTDKFPNDVAGLVLIDPSFAGQGDPKATPEQKQKDHAGYDQGQSANLRCAALAWGGKLSSSDTHGCFEPLPDRAPNEIAFLKEQYFKPYRYESVFSEAESFHGAERGKDIDSQEERAIAKPFGDKPVIVLTAGTSLPDDTQGERDNWKYGHDTLAARSTRGESIVVTNATHFIQLDQPQAVVEAVKKVVGKARLQASAH